MIPPTPAAQVPYGVVIAPAGVNVRTGPGTEYPVIGVAPFNTKGVISGKSADRQWWVTPLQGIANNQGWVSADYVKTYNTDNVPVVQAPPLPPPPTATPIPTAAPAPVHADRPSGPIRRPSIRANALPCVGRWIMCRPCGSIHTARTTKTIRSRVKAVARCARRSQPPMRCECK